MILIFGEWKPSGAEGAAQRISHIDQVFTDRHRTYVCFHNSSAFSFFGILNRPRPKTSQLTLSSRNPLHWIVLCLWLSQASCIYLHSIYSVSSLMGRVLLRWFPRPIFWDVHGIVPEEAELMNRASARTYYEKLESLCAKRAATVIVVSKQMEIHLRKKHPKVGSAKFLLIPILPNLPEVPWNKPLPLLIYSGGAQTWQNPEAVAQAVSEWAKKHSAMVFTPDIESFRRQISPLSVIIVTLNSEDLHAHYARATLGLILRDDHVVNRVSSPTKLSEYLHFGVIPVVKTRRIGDFDELGYRTWPLERLAIGDLPDEREMDAMRKTNRAIVDQLKVVQDKGLSEMKLLLDSLD